MSQKRHTLVIGPKEFTYLVVALAILTVAAVIFVLGIATYNKRGVTQALPAVMPTIDSANMQATSSETPVLAATVTTMTATPEITQIAHVVQPGETLTSIALLYGVELQTLLDINGLRADSVIQTGQTIIVPATSGQIGTYHEVKPGETLTTIAELYGLTIEELRVVNNLANADAIYAGQRLLIPGGGPGRVVQPVGSEGEASGIENSPALNNGPRSILEGDLDAGYPAIYEHTRFTVHYQPGSYADHHLAEVISLLEKSLSTVEAVLAVQLQGRFDIYVAGTLFEAPNAHLRGMSRSADRRLFLLLDGTGTPAENAYLVQHEMTHLVSWNTWGAPSSTMLSEGLATYAGKAALEGGGFMSYEQLCLGAYAAGRMASMAAIERDWQSFQGHIRDRFNYFGSACFVDYLIKTYGLDRMSRLYHTGDYVNLYGKDLSTLNIEWQSKLDGEQAKLSIDPGALALYSDQVAEAYGLVLNSYNGSEQMHQAYIAVDRARIALWQGDYSSVQRWLDEVYAVMGVTR